jgi:aspartokinase
MADLGVYTTDPKIRRRIRSLARYKGVDAQDAQDLTYYGSRELDPEKVNSLYEEQC